MKKNKALLNLTYIALGAVLISVCSLITVPLPISFTLQTFGIAVVLLLFGGKRGCGSILLYFALGLIGLPVFSGFKSGISGLLGITGGYLVGFIVTGLLYLALETIFKDKKGVNLVSLIIGNLACYLLGTAWYMIYFPDNAGVIYSLVYCVMPYVIPDALKLLLAYLIAKRLKPLISNEC